MNLPSMDSANSIARLVARIDSLERTVRELRAASGTLDGATIYKRGLRVVGGGVVDVFDETTGGRMLLGQGNLAIWDDFGTNPNGYGRLYCDPGSGLNVMRMFPPYSDGDGLQNSVTIQGRTPGLPGNVWIYTDGQLLLSADTVTWIDGPRLMLSGLPSVGSPDYQLGYDFDGSDWSVCLITSARKYKQDIQPAVIDPDAVLEIEPVTFRDIASVERSGDVAKVNFGVIADQLHELGLGEHLVTYGEDGEVEAAKYDRIGLALIPAVRKLRDRVNEQDKTIAVQATQIAALATRLATLEGVADE